MHIFWVCVILEKYFWKKEPKKFRIRDTPTLWIDADSRTNTNVFLGGPFFFLGGGGNFFFFFFFFFVPPPPPPPPPPAALKKHPPFRVMCTLMLTASLIWMLLITCSWSSCTEKHNILLPILCFLYHVPH